MSEKNKAAFLRELTALSIKHGVYIYAEYETVNLAFAIDGQCPPTAYQADGLEDMTNFEYTEVYGSIEWELKKQLDN